MQAAYDPLDERDRERGRGIMEAQKQGAQGAQATPKGYDKFDVATTTTSATTTTRIIAPTPSKSQSHKSLEPAPLRDSPAHITPLSSGSEAVDEVGGSDTRDRLAAFLPEPLLTSRDSSRRNYNSIRDVTKGDAFSAHGSTSPSNPCPLDSASRGMHITSQGNSLSPPGRGSLTA
jgi:hypothetical protein